MTPEIKCDNCGKKATYETIISGEHICEAEECLIELAMNNYMGDEITESEHLEYGDDE